MSGLHRLKIKDSAETRTIVLNQLWLPVGQYFLLDFNTDNDHTNIIPQSGSRDKLIASAVYHAQLLPLVYKM